ncbi:GDP-L-fucose synthase, partial [Favolaschia claudopus]
TGLVGKALQHIIETEPVGSRYGKLPNETWIFASSAEGDLSSAENLGIPAQTNKLYEKYKPTHVIHLCRAWCVELVPDVFGGLFKNMKYKLTFLRDNILINDNILHASYTHKTTKLISCLSTCVFPDKIHSGPPHESNFGYAHAKRMVDVQNHAYKEEFGCNFTSAIPTNIFGPHDNYDLEDAHVIPALVHKCYLAKKNGTPFIVSGTGKPLRQFIFSYDLAKLFVWMLREYDDVEPIILSASKRLPMPSVKAVGFEGHYSFDTTKADDCHGAFKFTPFEQALDLSVKWFVENYDSARTGMNKKP